jgi:predicted permease
MDSITTLALPFFGIIFLGFAVGKLIRIPEAGMAGLNVFIIYVALPALFFSLISQTPIDQLANWRFILGTSLATLTVFALGFAVGMLVTRGKIDAATMQGLAASYGNVGYMGPGLTLAAFGPPAVVPTALVFCFDNIIMFTLAPLGIAVARREAAGPGRLALTVARRIITHPFIIATILGVLAAAIELDLPRAIDQALDMLSGAAAPCALFAIGVAIAMRPVGNVPVELPLLIGLKLIAHPILAYVFLSAIGDFDPVWMYTAILIAALPIGVNVFVLSQQYGVWANRASSAVVISTIVAVGTVTGMLYLIGEGIIPVDLFPAAG